MDQHNIQTVVCVASPMDVTIKKEIRDTKTVYQFDIMDDTSQTLNFDPIVKLIDVSLERGAVLVNCAAGISRSASFVIAYLMKMQQKNFIDALSLVKRARPRISPNPFFMEQLVAYETTLNMV